MRLSTRVRAALGREDGVAQPLALSHRRVAKNTINQVVAIGLGAVTGGVAAIAVARTLGPEGLGVFAPAWQLALTLSIVGLLGLDQLLIRELSRNHNPDEVARTLPLACLVAVAFGAAAAGAALGGGLDPDLAWAFIAAAGYVIVSAPMFVLRGSFHAAERMGLETITLVIEAVVALAVVAAVLFAGWGPAWVVVALGAGRATNAAVSTVFARRVWGRIGIILNVRLWPRLLRASLALGVSYAVTTMILRFDVVFVGVLLPSSDAGLYGAAAVITFTVPMAITALNRSLYPVLSRAKGLDDPDLDRVFAATWRMLVIVGLAAAAGLAALAEPSLDLLFGSRFESAAPLLVALGLLIPVRLVNNLCATTLNSTVWHRRHALRLGAVICGGIVVNLVLIANAGVWGAVVAVAATEGALLAVLLRALRPLRPAVLRPLTEGLVVAVLVGGVAWLTPGHVLVRVVAGGAVFAGLAGAAFVFRPRSLTSRAAMLDRAA